MSIAPISRTFTKAMESLEKLTETRAKSNASDHEKYDRSLGKELDVLAEASHEPTEARDVLKSIQRLSVIRTKLDNCDSKYASNTMNGLFNSLLSNTDALLKPAPEEAPRVPTNEVGPTFVTIICACFTDCTKSGDLGDWKSWVVPIESCVAKRSIWHRKDFKEPLCFSFNNTAWDFRVMCGEHTIQQVWNLPDRQKTPIIAISRMGYVNQVRLLPITAKFDLQTEVLDVSLEDIGQAQNLVRYLLRMECTVVQRPEK
ncbi:MAG: hypothetical protein LQ352_006291 [Teloschistes flavicans]|nr:MAG: hypothetical protein LQ352_006291 [Teloschistes flavicans]